MLMQYGWYWQLACVYSIAYRFYSLFIATKVFELNPRRLTPAHRLADGLDYVPTNKYVLFGHHFAAIAGAGPLVGPILAAQMGFYRALSGYWLVWFWRVRYKTF